jgi:myo-inositol-1(or 4)-monophosphatase
LPASNVAELRAPLETIMREAGELARTTASGPFKRWTKGEDKSPVSEGDVAVNELLHARLPQLAPAADWISEETEDVPGARAAPLAWIVDPIDGTRAYLAGRADWTVSVALVEHGLPILAALYAPVTDEMFLAMRGEGATLNNVRLHAKPGDELAGARIAGPKRTLERIAGLQPGVLLEPKVFSLALRLARVAQGEFDAAFASKGGHDWDLAAADLLVHEAGGVLTDFVGRPLSYNRPALVHGALIAAGPARHGALVDLVRDLAPEFA